MTPKLPTCNTSSYTHTTTTTSASSVSLVGCQHDLVKAEWVTQACLWPLTHLVCCYCFLSNDICFSAASDNTSLCPANVAYHFVCHCVSFSLKLMWVVCEDMLYITVYLRLMIHWIKKLERFPFHLLNSKQQNSSLPLCRQFEERKKKREHSYLTLQMRPLQRVRKAHTAG